MLGILMSNEIDRSFEYFLYEDHLLTVDVWYERKTPRDDFEITEISVCNSDNEEIDLSVFNDLYIRRFASTNMISVAQDITETAEDWAAIN